MAKKSKKAAKKTAKKAKKSKKKVKKVVADQEKVRKEDRKEDHEEGQEGRSGQEEGGAEGCSCAGRAAAGRSGPGDADLWRHGRRQVTQKQLSGCGPDLAIQSGRLGVATHAAALFLLRP